MTKNDGKTELGTVITTLEGPSTSHFSFVVNNPKCRKGQFVQIECEDGLLLGLITDIRRANRYFERPESVAEYERSGRPMVESFPAADWEYIVADVRTYGMFNGGKLNKSAFPPSPGMSVRLADPKVLHDFLGFEDGGLMLGRIEHHDIDAKFNLSRILQKHLAILGISGSGKSYTVAALVEELLDRKKEQGRLSIVVIDLHGEYAGFKHSAGYSDKTEVFDGSKVRIALSKISAHQLKAYLPELSGPQMRELSRIMDRLRDGARAAGASYGLEELMAAIEAETMNESTKQTLASWLDELKRMKLFGKEDWPRLGELAQSGQLSVIDLSGINDQRRKQLIVAHIGRKLFDARRNHKIPPFLFLVEEAHNFAPEGVSRREAVSRGVIETIAREGRKFGASLCLVSQRPIQLSTTALSQCNTHLIMRVTNPYDLKHIGESSESIDSSIERSIAGLRVGEGIIMGEAVNYPIFIKVRERRSKKSTKGESLELAARQFEESQKVAEDDAEAFI